MNNLCTVLLIRVVWTRHPGSILFDVSGICFSSAMFTTKSFAGFHQHPTFPLLASHEKSTCGLLVLFLILNRFRAVQLITFGHFF